MSRLKKQGLSFNDLQQWEKGSDDFSMEHAEALIALVQHTQLPLAEALKQINQLSRSQAKILAKTVARETKASLAWVNWRALIMGSYASFGMIDKTTFRQPGVLNTNLIAVLKKAGIRHIYLFNELYGRSVQALYPIASMRGTLGIQRNQALTAILEEEGFTVHGVITSADPLGVAKPAALEKFAKLSENLYQLELVVRTPETADQARASLNSLMESEAYQALQAEYERLNLASPVRIFPIGFMSMLASRCALSIRMRKSWLLTIKFRAPIILWLSKPWLKAWR